MRCGGASPAAGLERPTAELDPVGVVLGVEVADRELDGVLFFVEVQAVDPEHRLTGLAAQVPGGDSGGAGRADALLRGGDGSAPPGVDQPDDRHPAAPAG